MIDEESEPLNIHESYVTNNRGNTTTPSTSWKKWAMATAAIALLVGLVGHSSRTSSTAMADFQSGFDLLGKPCRDCDDHHHSKANKDKKMKKVEKEQQLFDEHRKFVFKL